MSFFPLWKMQGGWIEKVVGRTFDSSILNSAENVFLEVSIIKLIDITCWILDKALWNFTST